MARSNRNRLAGFLAAAMLAAACGDEVSEEAYDGDAPPAPPEPGLEAAATSGSSVPGTAGAPVPAAAPDTSGAPVIPLDTTQVR